MKPGTWLFEHPGVNCWIIYWSIDCSMLDFEAMVMEWAFHRLRDRLTGPGMPTKITRRLPLTSSQERTETG